MIHIKSEMGVEKFLKAINSNMELNIIHFFMIFAKNIFEREWLAHLVLILLDYKMYRFFKLNCLHEPTLQFLRETEEKDGGVRAWATDRLSTCQCDQCTIR